MKRRWRVVLSCHDARLAARIERSLRTDAFEIERARSVDALRTLAAGWPADVVVLHAGHDDAQAAVLVESTPRSCLLLMVGARTAPGGAGDHRLVHVTRRHVQTDDLSRTLDSLLAGRDTGTAVTPPLDAWRILESLPALVDLRDAEGRFLLVNPRRAALHEVPGERLLGRLIHELIDGDALRGEQRLHAEALGAASVPATAEIVLTDHDGRRRTFLETKIAVDTDPGTDRAVLSVALEIDAGRAFEQRYRDPVDTSPQGELVRRGSTIVFANRALAVMLAYDDPEQVLALGDVAALLAPHEQERLDEYHAARLRGDPAPAIFEFDARRRDGSIVSLQGHGRRIEWRGRPAEHHTLLDITARKVAENALRVERSRARTYFEMAGVIVLTLDRKGRVTLINQRGCEALGYAQTDVVGRDWFQRFISMPVGQRMKREFLESVASGSSETTRCESEVLCADGTQRTVAWHNTLIRDDNGRVTGCVISGDDITRRLRAEADSRVHRERFQHLYDDNPAMFLTLDRDGSILSANRFGADHLGYDADLLMGCPASDLFVDEPPGAVMRRIAECFVGATDVRRWECLMQRRNRDRLWVRVSARVSIEPGGQPVLLVVCEDITEAHRLSEQLNFQATHDALTGLVNRHEFEKRLARVLASAREEASEHALCYLDLDQFKVINDTCGHSAGDELLRQLAGLLPRRVRRRDTLARLGGDEFGVLMEHCSLEQAKRVANGLRRAVADYRFVWEDKTFALGVSIGVVPIIGVSERVTGVLAAADAACYAAKDRGRNRIHVFHVDDAVLAQRQGEMQWVARLGTALEQDRFDLCFQPIVPLDPDGEQGLHYELLLRLREEDGRQTPPGAFLPAAERYGLSPRTDRWVVETAMRWLNSHPEHIDRLALCSINLSGASLGDEGFLALLLGLLESGRVPCNRICFEITETAAIANLSAAIRFIGVLKELGCRFALDDFGSGVSSFAYLKSLPVDFLKIDGVFVKDILTDPIDFAMVRSINDMGHVMGKRTIAEFVESQAILERLRDIGVDFAQGYGVGRPRPIADLE